MSADQQNTWRAALLLPGESSLVESGLRELSEYFGISREDARRQCETALADSKSEWEASPRETPEQALDFYRQTRSYLFEHIWWHATDIERNSANVAMMEYAARRAARDYLDFGAGVGANAILFASRGFNVTLADVSPTMLDFARWRLAQRGLAACFIDLNAQALPERAFDLISAVDVCEHLVDPCAEFERISRALKIDAALVFNCAVGSDEERPMHIVATMAPIFRGLRRNGLRVAKTDASKLNQPGFLVAQRVTRSRLESWWDRSFAEIRYSRFFAPGWARK